MRPLVVLAVLAGTACTASGASHHLAPARFERAPGWQVGASRVTTCPGVSRRRCTETSSWASTAPWRDCARCAGAEKTLARIGPGGIVIYLGLSAETYREPRVLRWPPVLRGRQVVSSVEGHAARFSLFGRGGRLHGFNAGLYVWFGRPHPTARQLARAQAELDSAKLP